MEPTSGDDLLNGTTGDDTIDALGGDDTINGLAGNDLLTGGAGDDIITGGTGNDTIIGGLEIDQVLVNVSTDGADSVNLGDDLDIVQVSADSATNIRLSFTSAEVGNGNANDAGTMLNQDGGLAVRFQAETAGVPGGDLSRYDDEGVVFVGGTGVTFDVRDLVSGAARGEAFEVVALGTSLADTSFAVIPTAAYYFNGGGGNDTITGGLANDFLVGGAADDVLTDTLGGADSAIGGGGNDVINLGAGDDRIAAFNVLADGADSVNLGTGADVVNVSATVGTTVTPTNIRLTFTSAEIGNGNANDGGSLLNQDGGLAVRLTAESGGVPSGVVSRYDDEGITFVGGTGVTFDVRDLVSGAARGELFEIVQLGTSGDDTIVALATTRPYYQNAGGGNDTVTGSLARDFLVGGAGNDRLDALAENDTLLGGGGNDRLIGGFGDNRLDGGAGRDTLSAGDGADVFAFALATDSTTGLGGRDRVFTFESGVDKLDLSALVGLESFAQVRLVELDNGNTVVRVDLDNDGRFDDFGVTVIQTTVVETDFIL